MPAGTRAGKKTLTSLLQSFHTVLQHRHLNVCLFPTVVDFSVALGFDPAEEVYRGSQI